MKATISWQIKWIKKQYNLWWYLCSVYCLFYDCFEYPIIWTQIQWRASYKHINFIISFYQRLRQDDIYAIEIHSFVDLIELTWFVLQRSIVCLVIVCIAKVPCNWTFFSRDLLVYHSSFPAIVTAANIFIAFLNIPLKCIWIFNQFNSIECSYGATIQ